MKTKTVATSMFYQPRPVSAEQRDQYLGMFSLKPLELDQVKRVSK